MNLIINLSPDEERTLLERASLSGDDVGKYVHRLIERHIKAPDALAAVLAPLREQFVDSGMSDADLDSLVEAARDEVWRDKLARQRSS